MIPVLLSFGPIHLYSYGLSIALGILLSFFLMSRQAVREGFPSQENVSDLLFAAVFWGFVGARVFYIAENLSYYLASPLKVFAVWEGGLIFYGGVIMGLAGFYMTVRVKKLSFWKTLDFITPYVALTHAFGRIGCFLNGCCYGKTCDLPWAVHFPEVAGKVHPTQLYEALFDLGLFFFLIAFRKRVKFEGQVALLYLLLYSLGRYLIEFLREPTWLWQGLSFNQWMSILIITVVFFIFQNKKNRKD